MAKFADIRSRITRSLLKNPRLAHFIWGPPGNGKTSMAYAIASDLEIPSEAIFMFRPSVKDAIDWSGLPDLSEETTVFKMPQLIADINAACAKFGIAMLIVDEIGHSDTRMFNALGGVLLDNEVAGHRIDPRCIKICTSNRTQDKAGVTQMPSQVKRRGMHHDVESDIKGWAKWANEEGGIEPWIVAFLRFKPDMLNKFDPNARSYPCEASWEMVSKSLPEDATQAEMTEMLSGLVGDEAAVAATGFKRTMDDLPDIDVIMVRPKEAEVPTKLEVLYAVVGALAHRTSPDNIDRVYEYIKRLPKDFTVMAMQDVYSRAKPEVRRDIKKSKAWQTFAIDFADVLCG